MERKAKAAAETSVYLVVVAAILVVVNIIAYVAIHKRADWTRNERFTLSQGSGRLVGSLKGPLQVDAYVTKGLPKLDAFVRDLTDLLRLYQQRGGANFQYTIIEAKSEEQRQAAKEAGCIEALLCSDDGIVSEGTHTSFFGVLDGKVLTAPNSNHILPGITRGLVLRLAQRAKIELHEHELRRPDLARVSELFLTGTTSEVLPVVCVDNQPIADGKPGPITRKLQEAYRDAVREACGSSQCNDK